ncbi:MAG: hypothetical protein AAF871_04845 [Pseudomonadota bacterium]
MALAAVLTLAVAAEDPERAKSPEFGEAALPFLNRLRLKSLDCRAAARVDLFQACALLATDRETAWAAHAEALIKCLPEALGARPIFYRPGVRDISFDEAWLLRMATAASEDDDNSFEFLLRSRVAAPHRRNMGFLIKTVSEQITRI